MLPIIGIGASAGGVDALEHLFRAMPPDLGAALVINTHLAPAKESLLPEIVGRFTNMPVAIAADGAVLKANHVYVCPPGAILSIELGNLKVAPATPPSNRRPIDVFLSSLAQNGRESAIGILLSGTGVDGTMGLKAIKACGGFTIVQGTDGSAPGFTGMPDSAIAAGVVDFVIPAGKIPEKLRSLLGSGAPPETPFDVDDNDDESEASRGARTEICALLLRQVGHDFGGYKHNTFMRCGFRRKAASASDASRPPIPTEGGHRFRSKPATPCRV